MARQQQHQAPHHPQEHQQHQHPLPAAGDHQPPLLLPLLLRLLPPPHLPLQHSQDLASLAWVEPPCQHPSQHQLLPPLLQLHQERAAYTARQLGMHQLPSPLPCMPAPRPPQLQQQQPARLRACS